VNLEDFILQLSEKYITNVLFPNIVQMADLFAEISPKIPSQLVEHVEKMLSSDPKSRPSAPMFILVSISYFIMSEFDCGNNKLVFNSNLVVGF